MNYSMNEREARGAEVTRYGPTATWGPEIDSPWPPPATKHYQAETGEGREVERLAVELVGRGCDWQTAWERAMRITAMSSMDFTQEECDLAIGLMRAKPITWEEATSIVLEAIKKALEEGTDLRTAVANLTAYTIPMMGREEDSRAIREQANHVAGHVQARHHYESTGQERKESYRRADQMQRYARYADCDCSERDLDRALELVRRGRTFDEAMAAVQGG